MTTAKSNLARNLTTALTDEMKNFRLGYYEGLSVEFIALDSRQEALDMLCTSPDTAVMVDAFTFIAAERRCGAEPAFQVERDGESGVSFELVVNTRIVPNLTNLTGRDRRFCAESLTSETGFVYPSLALRAYGIDLLDSSTVQIVTDGFEDDVEMVMGLGGGANQRLCESAALPVGRFEEIASDLSEDQLEEIGLFASNEVSSWPVIPYEVLVFPPDTLIPDVLREEIVRAMGAILEDDATPSDNLKTFFEADELVSVTEADFDDFRAWIRSIGWNMAAAN